jgi:hypothetical protein
MRRLGIGSSVVVMAVAVCFVGGCASNAPAPQVTQGKVVPKGYHLVVKQGTDYYCKWQSVTGSHTQRTEVCLTEDDLAADRNHGLSAGHTGSTGT